MNVNQECEIQTLVHKDRRIRGTQENNIIIRHFFKDTTEVQSNKFTFVEYKTTDSQKY